jgi:hypothetical protein
MAAQIHAPKLARGASPSWARPLVKSCALSFVPLADSWLMSRARQQADLGENG